MTVIYGLWDVLSLSCVALVLVINERKKQKIAAHRE